MEKGLAQLLGQKPAMEVGGLSRNGEKRMKRKDILEKKKAVDEAMKAASSVKDPLVSFSPFCHYDTIGLSVQLKSGRGDKLSSPMKQYIQNLLKVNMEGSYGSEWPAEEKVKRREMVAPEARYIFVHSFPDSGTNEMTALLGTGKTSNTITGARATIVGFVQYRFTIEEDLPVVYVYELQLEPSVQGKGLGRFLMQLIELIACKNSMGAVVLTVQKANFSAMNFYIGKLRYTIASISPSRVNPLIGVDSSYEILCKAFSDEAKAKLEVTSDALSSLLVEEEMKKDKEEEDGRKKQRRRESEK
ncbi:N-alpha-acetyltransferase 40 isoform X2 [Vitis riparia]|uniref:N-alpha-acetyltransferase 40 isoform X2 n=1 Tax=Vitis riparia TaxID=96939 RepID=UPI00155A2174|nr:N-alpha-acetyltransferase 40 isoform X2 [Vitis riparia]